MQDNRKFKHTPAAADHIGSTPSTLNKLRCTGDGPIFIRIGKGRGRIVYDVDDLDAWMAARRRKSTSDTGN